MDKEDTGTSKDTNSNHSSDSSIHTCKEERKKSGRGYSEVLDSKIWDGAFLT